MSSFVMYEKVYKTLEFELSNGKSGDECEKLYVSCRWGNKYWSYHVALVTKDGCFDNADYGLNIETCFVPDIGFLSDDEHAFWSELIGGAVIDILCDRFGWRIEDDDCEEKLEDYQYGDGAWMMAVWSEELNYYEKEKWTVHGI